MPEIKHSFTTGKMNKDLDERLVRPGEYRDALNVQIRTTDGGADGVGDAGAVQNLEGNYRIGSSFGDYDGTQNADTLEFNWAEYPGAQKKVSIASIADEKNDKAYFFFACVNEVPVEPDKIIDLAITGRKVFVDSIIEQDVDLTTEPVLVDVYAVADTTVGLLSDTINYNYIDDTSDYYGIFDIPPDNISVDQIKSNSIFKAYDADGDLLMQAKIKRVSVTSTASSIEFYDKQSFDIAQSSFIVIQDEKRTLSFNANKKVSAINIIDDLLFWTDGQTEPKRINIKTCKEGTSGYARHTRFFYTNEVTGNNSSALASSIGGAYGGNYGLNDYIKEENITVLKRAPKTPPTIHLDKAVPQPIEIQTYFNFLNENNFLIEYEEDQTITIQSNQFENSGNLYLANDILIFTSQDTGTLDIEEDLIIRCRFISYLDSDDNLSLVPTNTIQVQIGNIKDDENVNEIFSSALTDSTGTPGTGPTEGLNFLVEIDPTTTNPLFELKFPRFGYRYRYQDGEYSSFSPFSKIAFFPGAFDYSVKKGYNLGMRNTIRQLTIKDFIPFITDIGFDVEAVDILYKTTDNANVYVVKTVERDIDVEWENYTPDQSTYAQGNRMTGELTITSEMIHRVLPSNQILRAWDNVPRFAKAQEITGNRLLYGNYTQGYKVSKKVELVQEIQSSNTPTLQVPQPSIKSIRNYKLGMVFGDIYGRETPVIESGLTVGLQTDSEALTVTGDIYVSKSLCALQNRFVLTQMWRSEDPLTWMDYVKYYVKETTNEYYNLVMDRWYYAEENDNMWISFPSADRNKVDEETYLILKNKHGDNTPVLEPARYKVIAIENEAPDYIKISYRTLGRIELTNDETGHDSDIPLLTDDPDNLLGINEIALSNYNGFLDKYQIRGDLWWRWVAELDENGDGVTDQEITSGEFQRLSHWRINYATATVSAWDGIFKWEEKTGDETNLRLKMEGLGFYDATIQANMEAILAAGTGTPKLKYSLELQERVVENKPEFDGRFFVLIEKDTLIEEYVETLSGVDVDYSVTNSWDIHYIDTQKDNPATIGPFSTYTWGADDTDANNNVNVTGSDPGNASFAGLSGSPFQTTDPVANDYINFFALGCGQPGPPSYGNTGNGFETYKYWRRFTISRYNTGQSRARVFVDSARAAKFKWTNTGTTPTGVPSGSIAYYKPPGLEQGTASSGLGRMWFSQVIDNNYAGGGWQGIDQPGLQGLDDGNTGGLDELYSFINPGSYFRFEADPDTYYKIINTEIQENGSNAVTKNYRIEDDDSSTIISDPWAGLYTNKEIGTGCQGCEEDSQIFVCARHTKIIDFRRVNADGTLSDEGIDTTQFDPRGHVRHDGQGTFVLQQVKQVISSGGISVPPDNRAIWETEPKEGADLELYYAASHAIPMNIRLGNANSFIPIKSQISVERKSTSNVIVEQDLTFNDINSQEETFENINVKDVFHNETNPIAQIESTNTDSGVTSNHLFNIGIGDTIKFFHNDDTVTSSKILGHYKNVSAIPEFVATLMPQEEIDITIITDGLTPDLIFGIEDGVNFDTSPPTAQTGANVVGDDVPPGVFLYNFGAGNIRLSDTTWMTPYTLYAVKTIQPTGYYEIDGQVWKYPIKLGWHNCYSFGNGLESDRIRDDYNAPQLDNGIKVSTTLTDYKVEEIGSGMIYSGIYNSISSANNLNEFNMAEKITKTLNPSYGSIQALKTRDTDVITLCEDKVLKVLSNKDAVFNADGNTGLTATNKVLGTAVPFVGDYGISKNPESLASDQYRMYFTDKQRGAVLRLSRDGLTPISNVGMQTWFRENLRKANTALGTFDKVNGEYNLTLENTETNYNNTISFNEASKGWVSFKSFIPDSGVSVSGKYLTSKNGLIYQHYWKEFEDNGFYDDNVYVNGDCIPFEGLPTQYRRCVERNKFYNTQYDSRISVLFNDMPGSVKSFQALNYEGSQSRVVKYTEESVVDDTGNQVYNLAGDLLGDNEYYNLFRKNGWYVDSFKTDLQTGNIPEFKNKENKWFNKLYGETTDFNNLDTKEFSVQGIGVISDAIFPEEPIVNPCVGNFAPYVNGQISYTVNEGQMVTLAGDIVYPDPVYTGFQGLVFLITSTAEEALNYNQDNAQLMQNLADNNNIIVSGGSTSDPTSVAYDLVFYSSVNASSSYSNYYQGTANEFDWVNNIETPTNLDGDVTWWGSALYSAMAAADPINNGVNSYGYWNSGAGSFLSVSPTQIAQPIFIVPDGMVEDEQETFWFTAMDGDAPFLDCEGNPIQVEITIVSSDTEVVPEPQYLSLQLFEQLDFFVNGVNGTPITTISEGDVPMVVLQTANVPDGTQVGFSLVMPPASSGFVSAEDFSNPNIGVPAVGAIMTIENNVASFQLETIEDLLVEGNEIGFLVLTNIVNDQADVEFAQTNTGSPPSDITDSNGFVFTPLISPFTILDTTELPVDVRLLAGIGKTSNSVNQTSTSGESNILRQVGDGVDEIPIDADGNVVSVLQYEGETALLLQVTALGNSIFGHVDPSQNCGDSDHPRPANQEFGGGTYTPTQILPSGGFGGQSAVYENIQFYHGTQCDTSYGSYTDLVPYNDIKKIIIKNVDLVGQVGNSTTNYQGSQKLNIIYVLADDFVIPDFNNLTQLDQDEQLSYAVPETQSGSGGSSCDPLEIVQGIPRYKVRAEFVLASVDSPDEVNPVKINIGLKLLNTDAYFSNLDYTSFDPVNDLRVQPMSDHINQIQSDNLGLYACDECNPINKFPELQSDGTTAESALSNINSSVNIEEFDNVSGYPCRTVRLAVPTGATIANGEMPSEVKLRISTNQISYGSGGWPMIGFTGIVQVTFPQNVNIMQPSEDIPPYAITNNAAITTLQANGVADPMNFLTGSTSLVDMTSEIGVEQVSEIEGVATEYEITIPIDPNFTAPSTGGEFNIVVPYTAYTSCFDGQGNVVIC